MAKIKTGPKVKRKGGGVAAKSRAVDELAQRLSGATGVIVSEYRALRVADLQELRKKLRPRGVEYHVVKNSLFARAAAKLHRESLGSLLVGPSAVALGRGDEIDLARSVVDEARAFKALRIIGGFVGGSALSQEDVISLARLPGRPQLQAQLVGSLQAPLGQLAATLVSPVQNLIRVLAARSHS